ncbi:MAG: hypothetical protein U9Q22_07650, partial [Candidatus Altiarchaeota archaeon]|nr:hypothetical protein [Candidatus Altiarchaeota archaeon]
MKKRRILVWTTLMIFFVLTINANAISDKDLADIYYDQAEEAYNTGDCMNASGLANRSLGLYTKIKDDAGRLKTLELIGEINTCLRNNGDNFYNKALKECNKGTENGYRNCITWAEKAKGQYSLIPDQLGVSKCETQIQYAEKEIELIMKKAADKLCNDAMKLYDGEDVFNARVKAKEARGKYMEINHNEGIEKCDALLEAIRIYIDGIIQEAEVNYRYATEHYQKAMESSKFDDYDTAMGHAKKAKNLFNQVRNIEGGAKSEDLIAVINNAITKLETKFRREADAKYMRGLNEFLYGQSERDGSKQRKHFNTAKSYLGKARSVYKQLYDWADSIKNSRLKTEKRDLYKGELRKCDNKLREI